MDITSAIKELLASQMCFFRSLIRNKYTQAFHSPKGAKFRIILGILERARIDTLYRPPTHPSSPYERSPLVQVFRDCSNFLRLYDQYLQIG